MVLARGLAYRRHQRKRTLNRYLSIYKLDADYLAHCTLHNRPGSCACTKRQKGKPKQGAGMCSAWDRTRIYAWRKQAKALQFFVLGGGDITGDTVTRFHYSLQRHRPY